MLPGTPERATHDYERHGTSSLYAALNIASAARSSARCTTATARRVPEVPQDDRRATSPHELDVHLVLDNASTHKTPTVQRWLAHAPAVRPALHPDLQLAGSTSSNAGSPS